MPNSSHRASLTYLKESKTPVVSLSPAGVSQVHDLFLRNRGLLCRSLGLMMRELSK
ncbi:hypothetical protein BDV40DRAFT_260722 [Aspergillus tamarii]|uniref:Uncharacterized protein n=1 Tax=Aspergillus tamarii TaxID=41984 RepID=A0A5N6V073_ASPTM|nr:hypothetical protein BDV40DRAFT_260722 [Aspergillus tamarii]